MNTLPDHPADLIELALADLEKVRADDRYVVNMGKWHAAGDSREHAVCAVCLAGSVMAKSLGEEPSTTTGPSQFPEGIRGKLKALDWFRDGSVFMALYAMGFDPHSEIPEYTAVTAYEDDPEAFIAAMRDMAAMLRAAIPATPSA